MIATDGRYKFSRLFAVLAHDYFYALLYFSLVVWSTVCY